jgi:hypothetical protein
VAGKRKKKREDEGPVNPLTTLIKKAYFTSPSKNTSLVPIGRVTSRASMRETSMSKHGGRGWRLRPGYMGTGAVVFPDSGKATQDFLKGLGRPLKGSDREGWLVHAKRIGMAPDVAERAWETLSKSGVAETVETLRSVFEATSWWGFSVPHLFQTGATKQGPYKLPTPLDNKDPKSKGKPGVPVSAIPSFPYHTQAAQQVYEKALELVGLYPLDNPTEILKKAVNASQINPIMDLTPEDEKLLRMGIEWAQNGPARSKGNRIGGAPGGPFNSTGAGRVLKKRGAP